MTDSFNPYCEWLGLDAGVAAPNLYQLLGIDRDASPDRVKRAADYAINRVRGIRPGPRAAAWSQLIDELRQAQVTLLDSQRRAEYDGSLASAGTGRQATEPTPAVVPSPTPFHAEADNSYAFPPGMRPAPHSPQMPLTHPAPSSHPAGHHPTAFPSPIHHSQTPAPHAAWPASGTPQASHNYADPMAPVGGPYGAPATSLPPAGSSPAGAYAPTSPTFPAPLARPVAASAAHAHYDPMAPLASGAAGVAPGGAPRVAVVYGAAPLATPVAPAPVMKAVPAAVIAPVPMTAPLSPAPMLGAPLATAMPAPARKVRSRRGNLVQNLVLGGVAIAMIGAVVIALNSGLNKPRIEDIALNQAAQSGPSPSGSPAQPAPNRPRPTFVPPAKTDMPALPVEPKPIDVTPANPPASESPMPEDPAMPAPSAPMPEPQPAPSTTREPTEQEKAQIAQALKAALEAAAQQNFDAADASLSRVEALPKSAEDEKKFTGARRLIHGARAFTDAVKQAFTALKPEQQIRFNNSTVKVLEATPEGVSVEVVPGTVKKYTLDKLPLGLKYGFVNAVIPPEEAANALAKAGFHATQPGGDTAEARHFLEEAQAAGADVEGALLVLSESSGPVAVAMTPPASEPTPTNTPTPAPTSTPTPTPEPAPTSPPTAKELQDLTKLAQEARAALSERNLDEADKALAKAEELTKLPEHKEKIARLKLLAYYTREFWRAVEESLKGLTSGQEISIGDTLIAVVEASPNHLVIRAAGQNRRYSLREMPGGLAMAIANLWLNESDAATRVVKGCVYAVEKKGNDPAKARQLWQEAEQMGVDTSGLQLTLDESYDFTK